MSWVFATFVRHGDKWMVSGWPTIHSELFSGNSLYTHLLSGHQLLRNMGAFLSERHGGMLYSRRVGENPNESDHLGEIGVAAVNFIVRKEMGWIFRQQPISDRGIDGEIEIQTPDRDATGLLIALQIKTGSSYLSEKTDSGFVFRGKNRHLSYWRRHSLPVVVVLHDPDANISYWQSVEDEHIEKTPKGWKLEVPFSQVLNKSAMKALNELAKGPIYERRLRRLVLDRPWMLLLERGEQLFLEAEEWINKSSGRGKLSLSARSGDGEERLVQDWPLVMFPGWPYELVFRQLFPWADLAVDEDFYESYDEYAFDNECGIWDGEDKRYIGHTDDFCEWRERLPELRPYDIVGSGEVALYRLELVLNEVGNAFLMLDRFLETGERPGGPNPEGLSSATTLGLKGVALRYFGPPAEED